MGSAFSCLPRYGWCVPKHHHDSGDTRNRSQSSRRIKGHRRSLSAAFNMADMDNEYNVEMVNINMASEEELMTLPGISRLIARSIIDYRHQISGFKRVEDLALVTGVGASKLAVLRQEICVSSKKTSSPVNSLHSSRHDLSFQDNYSRTSTKSLASGLKPVCVNVNSSNVFQLMKVHGITQQLAENIVIYRDKKGHFRNLDDLLKVKGIKSGLLSAIRPNLTLDDAPSSDNSASHSVRNSSTAPNSTYSGANMFSADTGSVVIRKDDSQEDLCSLYGPLARRSERNVSRSVSQYSTTMRLMDVVRVASWNLQQCSSQKAANPGVKEVFAMTLLENEVSIVAVQDLSDVGALQQLCDELNSPTIPNVKKWTTRSSKWKCMTSQSAPQNGQKTSAHFGFVWDSSLGIELISKELPTFASMTSSLKIHACLAMFKIKDFLLPLLNVQCKRKQNGSCGDHTTGAQHELSSFMAALDERTVDYDQHVLIAGDFNSPPDSPEFSLLHERGYSRMFSGEQYTDISVENMRGNRCLDNIWMAGGLQLSDTAKPEVIRDGLTSPWIPNGWGWGGLISDRCPIIVELKTSTDVTRMPEDINIAIRSAVS